MGDPGFNYGRVPRIGVSMEPRLVIGRLDYYVVVWGEVSCGVRYGVI